MSGPLRTLGPAALGLCALTLAFSARAVWDIATVDSGGDVGWYSSLALDTSGNPHLSYYDYTNQDLRYAVFNGTGWSLETVDPNACGAGTSIAVDTSNRPHIAYRALNGELRYTVKNAGVWGTPEVRDTSLYAEIPSPSLRLDSNQRPNLTYVRSGTGLRFQRYDGSAWATSLVSSASDPQEHCLALDAANDPHVAHYNNSKRTYYFNGSGSPVTWSLNTPDDPGANEGPYLSCALDGSGRPHISLARVNIVSYHVYDNDLRHYFYNGSSWTEETVDSVGDVGWYTCIAVDGSQYAHISYHDHGNWSLKYATNASGSWTAQTVDVNGGVGYTTSLRLDGAGAPRIAYYDVTNKDLKYARWVGGPYQISGRVTESGAGVGGVYVFLTGALSSVVRTGSDGSYAFTAVPAGSYTVTPVLAGYTAMPQSRSYALSSSQTGQDYLLAAGTGGFFIGGYILDAYNREMANVAVNLQTYAAGNTVTVSNQLTDALGYYRFLNLSPGDYTVRPTSGEYDFSPEARNFPALNAHQDGQNFTGSPKGSQFTLGGSVKDSQNLGLADVQVSLTGTTFTASALTDPQGRFTFSGLWLGDYTLQAAKTGWFIVSPLRQFTPLAADTTVQFYALLGSELPLEVKLIGNLFRPNRGERVSIWYTLPARGQVTIKLYTLDGVFVRTLVEEEQQAGLNHAVWNGTNPDGQVVASGIYLADIRLPNARQLKKICVLK